MTWRTKTRRTEGTGRRESNGDVNGEGEGENGDDAKSEQEGGTGGSIEGCNPRRTRSGVLVTRVASTGGMQRGVSGWRATGEREMRAQVVRSAGGMGRQVHCKGKRCDGDVGRQAAYVRQMRDPKRWEAREVTDCDSGTTYREVWYCKHDGTWCLDIP